MVLIKTGLTYSLILSVDWSQYRRRVSGDARRFLGAIEMIQGHAAGAHGVSLLNGLGNVGLGQNNRFGQLTAVSEVSGDGGGESAAGAVDVFGLHPVAGESLQAG